MSRFDHHGRSVGVVSATLDLAGVVSLVVSVVIREASNTVGMARSPIADILAALAMISILAAGAVAGRALWRQPLTGASGRRATRAALFNMLFLPALKVVEWIALAMGGGFHVDWGLPFFPFWLGSALLALGLAAVDREERSRALLLGPVMLAVALLTFFVGDMV